VPYSNTNEHECYPSLAYLVFNKNVFTELIAPYLGSKYGRNPKKFPFSNNVKRTSGESNLIGRRAEGTFTVTKKITSSGRRM
jgi:hypothetical protein